VNETFERFWVSWLNNDRWRQFAKYGPGSKFFRSQAYLKLDMARRYLITSYKCCQAPTLFQEVKTFCMFIGHAKSGSTLIGSLLDAHPNAILADEADPLHYISNGFDRDQIFHILLKGSRREAIKGRVTARRLKPYSLEVPGQWQGRYSQLQVIGDSRAGPSTGRLAQEPGLLLRLPWVMRGVEVKLIHVIRNPYDPISLMMLRGKRTFENAITHYFDYCETLAAIHQQMNSSNLLAVKYEELICQPEISLVKICQFLGLEATDDYLKACIDILYKSPEQSRQMVEWNAKWIAVVKNKINQFDFLEGYTYEH
jgi:hypothetical protein